MTLNQTLRYDVLGRKVSVEYHEDGWKVFWVSDDGKKRPIDDLIIPSSLSKNEIKQYLEDILHELAAEKNKRD